MEITKREMGQVIVVGLEGSLDTGTSPDADKYLSELQAEGATKIVLDLEKLDYISSSGLRIILATTKRLTASGGGLRLCNLNETVQDVFDISGFSSILKLFPSVDKAVEGF